MSGLGMNMNININEKVWVKTNTQVALKTYKIINVGYIVRTLNQYNKHHVSSNVVKCLSIKIVVTYNGSCVCSTMSNMDACSRAQDPTRHISNE
jgi:hypothetical protein